MSDTTSGSGLMSALMDPGVDALLGAAQGFGAAAMPSRLPVPLGAVLGQGAGGLLAGLKSGQQAQLAQQQIQAVQIANQRGQVGLDWYKQMTGGGAPLGAPAPAGASSPMSATSASPGAAGGPTAGALLAAPASSVTSAPGNAVQGAGPPSASVNGVQVTDNNGRYLFSPQQLANMSYMSMAMGDARASAAFVGHAQTAAGGAGYAMGPNGTAFAVPGGGKDPNTIAANTAAEKWPRRSSYRRRLAARLRPRRL